MREHPIRPYGIFLILLLAIQVLALPIATLCQSDQLKQPPPDNLENTKPNDPQRIQKDAFKRLAELAKHVKEIGDPTDRVRLQARIAEALWQHDEPGARQLFTQAYEDAIAVPPPANTNPSESLSCGQIRADIVRSISEHDPSLAVQFVMRDKDERTCSYGSRERNTSEDARSVMLVQLAHSILEKEPHTAAQLARKSLSGGIASQLPELITRLKAVQPDLGNELADAVIEHIRNDDVQAGELGDTGIEIFGLSIQGPGRATLNKDKKVDAALAIRLLNASLIAIRRFADKLEANKIAVGSGSSVFSPEASEEELAASFYVALTDFLPAFDHYDKKDAADARHLLNRLAAHMNPIERTHMYVYYDNGDTVESLLKEAEANKNEKAKNDLYEMASTLALIKGDFDEALEIAQKASGEEKRVALHDSAIGRRITKLIDEKKYEEVGQWINRMIQPVGQVRLFLYLAEQGKQVGEKKAILQFLEEASSRLMKISDAHPLVQAAVLIDIGRVAATIDPVEGFEHLKAATSIINIAGGLAVDPKVQSRYTGIVRPTDSLSLFCTDLRLFETLARADYFQAIKLTEEFTDRTLRDGVQLAVIQAALPKKPTFR